MKSENMSLDQLGLTIEMLGQNIANAPAEEMENGIAQTTTTARRIQAATNLSVKRGRRFIMVKFITANVFRFMKGLG